MRVFLAISCLAVLAAARPDVSHLGLNYHSGFSGTTVSPTISSNGIAIESTIAPSLDQLGGSSTLAPTLGPLGLTSTLAPALGYSGLFSTPLPIGFSNFGGLDATAIPSTLSPFGVTSAPSALSAFGLDVTSTLGPYGLGYDAAANAGFIRHQTPVVSKHFYVHSAPEEAREEYHRHLVLGTPQKSYRVVFIKAPSSQTATRLSASFAPNEEKTVIYVLSKKPEDLQINDIQAPQPTEPSKPEVFFIKYKTPEEAAHAQQQIQAQYDALGGYSQVSDEGVAPLTSVIGALGQSVSEVDIANARFDTVHGPVQYSTALGAGAIHHVGTPLSTVAPGSYGFDSLAYSSSLAPAVSTFSPFYSTTLAPAVSTIAPGIGSFDSILSSTLAPAVSTISPIAEIDLGEKYLPPRKKA